MVEPALKIEPLAAIPALSEPAESIGGVTLSCPAELALVTIAFGDEAAGDVAEKVGAHIAVGASVEVAIAHSTSASELHCRAAMLQPGQLWLMAEADPVELFQAARKMMGEQVWLTDQSDGWCAIRVESLDRPFSKVDAVMERLCMLDLHTMETGAATRTLMAHLSVILVKEAAGSYLLLGARSSAQDLYGAVRLAARNTG